MVHDRHVPALSAFGVNARGDRLYRVLLRDGALAPAALAARLGWDDSDVRDQVRLLSELGLVTTTGREVTTVSPQLALGRLVEREARELADREQRLEHLRGSIRDYAAEERGPDPTGATLQPLEVHSGPAVGPVVDALLRSTTGTLRLIHPLEWLDDPGWSKSDTLLSWEIQGGRPTRCIYPAEALHRSEALAVMRRAAETGEQIRLMNRPPSRLLVFGHDAALVPLEWGRHPTRRVVVRTSGVVDAMCLLFDVLWRAAVPMPTETLAEGDPAEVRLQVLRMLAAGAKDETISRQLGLSLRTVRRRIAELLTELDAATRFQAGAEAVRRKLV